MRYSKHAMHEGYQESSVDKSTTPQLCRSHHHPASFRCDDSVDHHRAVVFRRDDSASHHNSKVGPFRNDGSVGRSQRTKESSSQGNQAHYGWGLPTPPAQLNNSNPKSSSSRSIKQRKLTQKLKQHWGTIDWSEDIEPYNYVALPQRVDSGLPTGINRKP
ncbi:acetyl-CoA carboxylase 2 [Dorcoceras hygrometricum]|uniref:Acetyl-CoA carboxylase 2 n=1 Tax=Dorcoceras hygrometricum TaxID=472368 RepID=A0A2Z7B1Y2_9LAMI|nr:acetyl-CoA carboxylase 2 [Dorcoceras hygrometricum]